MSVQDDLVRPSPADSEELSLLREWFQWWLAADDAPTKMPNSLHVRTSMCLLVRQLGVPGPEKEVT